MKTNILPEFQAILVYYSDRTRAVCSSESRSLSGHPVTVSPPPSPRSLAAGHGSLRPPKRGRFARAHRPPPLPTPPVSLCLLLGCFCWLLRSQCPEGIDANLATLLTRYPTPAARMNQLTPQGWYKWWLFVLLREIKIELRGGCGSSVSLEAGPGCKQRLTWILINKSL